ncbi:MAG: tRNA (N(6)-L-threonylcarbamoyladenosine(37)-C(2))-methylthiotransferase MtaB, partial [Pseudomonadota bacterium]
MNVHLNTLGCRLNEAELETWADQFRARGARLVASPDLADLTVLNTCDVTAEAVRKSRQTLRRLHRANPAAKLVVTGCHATLSNDAVAAELGVDLVLDNQAKDNLVDTALASLELPVMPEIATAPSEPSLYLRNRHRAFIKVQDGCRYRCTY